MARLGASGTRRGAPDPLAFPPGLGRGCASTPIAAAPAAGAPDPKEEAARLTDEAGRLITAPGNNRTNWLHARTPAERAIELDPNPAADLREAEQHAGRAILLGPHRAARHSALGAFFRQQGRWEQARAATLRAVELGPMQHASRANAGYMSLVLGNSGEAIPLVRGTLAVARPDHGFRMGWLTYLALAELHRERWAEAASLFREASAGRAFLPQAHAGALLAAALHRAGAPASQVEATVANVRADDPAMGAAWLRANPLSSDPRFAARQGPVPRAVAEAGLT